MMAWQTYTYMSHVGRAQAARQEHRPVHCRVSVVTAFLVGLIRQQEGDTGLCGGRVETTGTRAKIARGSNDCRNHPEWMVEGSQRSPPGAFGYS